jgi:type II secretory pathway component PulJ
MSDTLAFLATWRDMGWAAALMLVGIAAVMIVALVLFIAAYGHPETKEMRAIRRKRRQRVAAMKLLRTTAERDCFRDAKGITR